MMEVCVHDLVAQHEMQSQGLAGPVMQEQLNQRDYFYFTG